MKNGGTKLWCMKSEVDEEWMRKIVMYEIVRRTSGGEL